MYRLQRSRAAVFHSCSDVLVSAIRYCLEGIFHQDRLVRQSVIDMTVNKEFQQLIQLVLLHHQPIIQELGEFLRLEGLRTTANTILDHMLGFPPSLGKPLPPYSRVSLI